MDLKFGRYRGIEMLPQFMIVTGMCVALVVAARWVKREAARVEGTRRAQSSLGRTDDRRMPRLQLDPATGRYYPVG